VKAIGTPQEIESTAVSRTVAPEDEGDLAIPAPEPLKHRPPVGVAGAGDHLIVGTVPST
jgi:hypothetical protein